MGAGRRSDKAADDSAAFALPRDGGAGHHRADTGSHRRPVIIAVVVLAILLALGLAAFTAWRGLTGGSDDPSTPKALPSKTAPPTSSAPPDVYVPGGLIGPGLTEPGVLVRAEPDAQGDVEVTERVRLIVPVTELTIAPPAAPATGAGAGLAPRLASLQVTADDLVVTVPKGGVISSPLRLELPLAASTLSLRYRLLGAVERSAPAPPGRALVLMPPVSAGSLPGTLPVVVEVSGARVRNLYCPRLPVAEQLCGRAGADRWHTPVLTPKTATVLAQVDLPAPGETP